MATDLSTLPNSAILLQIVSAKRDCAVVWAVAHSGRPDSPLPITAHPSECCCEGTGKVPILDPTLMRLPCPWCDGRGKDCLTITQSEIEPHCQGRTWVPNPDAWAMKKALHQAGFQLTEQHTMHEYNPDAYMALCFRYQDLTMIPHLPIFDADPERARLLAVTRALGSLPCNN